MVRVGETNAEVSVEEVSVEKVKGQRKSMSRGTQRAREVGSERRGVIECARMS